MNKGPALLMCLCIIADLLALEMLYPFLPFMVESFGIKEKDIGLYVGIIGSFFGIGQLISGFFWGKLSDKYGRRAPLMAGLLGNLIAMTLFGLSKNWYMAAVVQFVQGVMNGNFGIVFSVVCEYYVGEELGRALGYVGLSYGIGLSAATAVGGLAAQPAKQYPHVFGHFSPFIKFPFLFPCLISAVYTLVVLLMIFFKLPETRGMNNYASQQDEEHMPINRSSKPIFVPHTRVWTSLTGVLCVMTFLHWWGMFGYMQMLGVWMSTPVNLQGLGFSSIEISFYFISWGVLTLVFYQLVWPRILSHETKRGKRLRVWDVVRVGLLMDILYFVCFPFLRDLALRNRIAMWFVLEIFEFCGAVAINSYYMAIQMVVNKSVVPEISGQINGLVTTCLAIGKAVAPFTAGIAFTYSLTQPQNSIFTNFHLIFNLFAISQVGMFGLSFVATWLYPKTKQIRLA